MEHVMDGELLRRRVDMDLIGVGGNGAQMAACLARLDIAIRALGHPHGLSVRAYDPDGVSEANIGRQVYGPADVGHNKALLTIHRLNVFYGLDWEAVPLACTRNTRDSPDIVISCVDSRAARRELHHRLRQHCRTRYWLDLGNTENTAQIVLGQPSGGPGGRNDTRLPCVTELYPELLDSSIPDDIRPSCSVRMSLDAQGLFVNDVAVRFGAQLLYELFSRGRLEAHGAVINIDSKRTAPIAADPASWARYGYVPGRAKRKCRAGRSKSA